MGYERKATNRKAQIRGKSPRVEKSTQVAEKEAPKLQNKIRAETVTKSKVSDIPKYEDIGLSGRSGRLDKYWEGEDIITYYKQFRNGLPDLPQNYRFWDHGWLMQYFGLQGWEFGNWTTQEDRFNYVSAVGISFFDLMKTLRISSKDLGLRGKLGIAIGARGKGKASAHYEPGTNIINLTRYWDYGNAQGRLKEVSPRNPKLAYFLNTGGVGSLAHEFGHAFDYWIGGYFDQNKESFSLSGGRSLRISVNEDLIKLKTPRGITEKILALIIWENYKKKKPTSYYIKLRENAGENDYWFRRNEIFARTFEQYISYKIAQKNGFNAFLAFPKYSVFPEGIYLPDPLLKKVVPSFDQLMVSCRKILKSKS